MKISKLVALFTFLMLVIALGGAWLALWTTQKSEFFKHRIALANLSYERHLSLSSNTYQLFKQYGDAMLIGDRDNGKGEAELIKKVRQDISDIRKTIGREIELVGEEEIEELELLAEIENKIEDLIVKFESFRIGNNNEKISQHWENLSNILDNDIDNDFHFLINEALEEEAEEVEETRLEGVAHAARAKQLALIFATFAISITGISVLIYRRQIAEPLRQLMNGVHHFSNGDFDQHINAQGHTEIAEISNVLDGMAEKVSTRTRNLTEANAELEEAVQKRTAELERLLEEAEVNAMNRRQLLADVSHELRTPLTIIQGESEVALRGKPKTVEEYQEALRRARDTAKHTNQLVNDLLFISRKESGELRLNLKDTDLRDLMEQTLETFDADVSLHCSLDHAFASVDALRIRQSVVALLQNARKYGGDEVVACLESIAGGYTITIHDSGPGLSNDEKKLAFERFFRGSNANENYSEGTGLGLPVVRAIVEAHGGSAQLHDREGGGLSAVIQLPARPQLRAVS